MYDVPTAIRYVQKMTSMPERS